MRYFQRLFQNVDMMPLHHALIRQPELWNTETFRTTYKDTPHGAVDDIWLRYSDQERTANPEDTSEVQNDHGAVWYPGAQALPEAKPLILDLMRYTGAYELVRSVISRIPPGGRILRHADAVGDYVHLGDIARYHFVVQGLPGSQFVCGNEAIDMLTGEVWWFSAHDEHEVKNNSSDDRISLMCDLRKWPA